MRMNTSQLASDGLVTRLADKISDTERKLSMQAKTLSKISANVTLLQPVSQKNHYVVDDDSPRLQFDNSPHKNI